MLVSVMVVTVKHATSSFTGDFIGAESTMPIQMVASVNISPAIKMKPASMGNTLVNKNQ